MLRVHAGPVPHEPLRVMLVISSLEHGGAERQVIELANGLDPRRFDVHVCCLQEHNPLAGGLRERGRRCHVVARRGRYDVGVIGRVARLMRRLRVQLAHAFLFDAEMVTRLAARWARVPIVVASERNTDYHVPWWQWLGKRLTRNLFDLLIANSEAGQRFNVRTFGIAPERIRVIRNGVDTRRFRPLDRHDARQRLGIPEQALAVGMVATFKRQKNHADFFRMAHALAQQHPDAVFVCVGEALRDNQQGAADYQREVLALVHALRLPQRTLFLGTRDDMPEVYSALDVAVLPSRREGTPNVLLEAMACGVPVVATDVSDNRHVVPDGVTGFVVPLGDVDALTQRVTTLLADPARRAEMGRAARAWATREFSTDALIARTAKVYLELAQRKLNWH